MVRDGERRQYGEVELAADTCSVCRRVLGKDPLAEVILLEGCVAD